MRTHATARISLAVPLALLLLGCPTRPAPKSDAAGTSDADQDASGGGGTAGNAGTAGTHGGSAGAGGAAGSSAGASGNSDGLGGAAGAAAGTGGGTKDGQRCSLAADCASQVCTPFYVDVDGDGYGTGQATGFCGTTPPIGYAAQSGDCCDNASNLAVAKMIHPGADFQTTSAAGTCNITWDYDCSGKIEKDRTDCSSCSADCSCVQSEFPDADCGTSQAGTDCNLSGAPTPTCHMTLGSAGPVACR